MGLLHAELGHVGYWGLTKCERRGGLSVAFPAG